MTSFVELGLAEPIVKALVAANHLVPTPIQAQAIPQVMQGKDLLGIAQTGTGKTAAFALPILHRLAADKRRAPKRGCRALILSPTRELASQIAERVRTYGRQVGLTSTTVFGGVSAYPQIKALAGGIDIVVATPGRLIDHMNEGHVKLDAVEVVVLDEADQMLDMGFVHAIRRISAALPKQRQSLFFSATMPPEIAKLAAGFLTDPVTVAVTPVASTVDRIEQRVLLIEAERKRALLAEILTDTTIGRALVFTRTKHGADRVVRHLETAGIDAAAIHGNKSQSQRERALGDFRTGRTRVLIATDIAARGIDVAGVTHVINFELPNVAEAYVHRIGRTARAGADGIAISLCDHTERSYLRGIEKLIRQTLPLADHRTGGNGAAIEARADGPKPSGDHRRPARGGRPPQHRGHAPAAGQRRSQSGHAARQSHGGR